MIITIKNCLRSVVYALRRKVDFFLSVMFPRKYAGILYKRAFGHAIDWRHPRDLNEWINKIAFMTDTSQWPMLADKFAVRKYVVNKGLERMLIRQYGAWVSPEDIPLFLLPIPFVLKANNGSGDHLFIRSKEDIDKKEILRRCEVWSRKRFGRASGERFYLKIPFKIIAEEILDIKRQDFESTSIIDYKIWCFRGRPYIIFVIYDRVSESSCGKTKVEIKDTQWRNRNDMFMETREFCLGDGRAVKPDCLDDLLYAAKTLSDGLPQARVDFYIIDSKPYFGEITLQSYCGRMNYFSNEALVEMGNLIEPV